MNFSKMLFRFEFHIYYYHLHSLSHIHLGVIGAFTYTLLLLCSPASDLWIGLHMFAMWCPLLYHTNCQNKNGYPHWKYSKFYQDRNAIRVENARTPWIDIKNWDQIGTMWSGVKIIHPQTTCFSNGVRTT